MRHHRFFSKNGPFTAVCIVPADLESSSGREMLAHANRYKKALNKKINSPCITVMNSASRERHPATYIEGLSRNNASLDIVAHRLGRDAVGLCDQSVVLSCTEIAELLANQFGNQLKDIRHIRLACCNSATVYPGDDSKSLAERLRDSLCSAPYNANITVSGFVGYIGEFKDSKHSYCSDTPTPNSRTRYHRASECEATFYANGTMKPAKRQLTPMLLIDEDKHTETAEETKLAPSITAIALNTKPDLEKTTKSTACRR